MDQHNPDPRRYEHAGPHTSPYPVPDPPTVHDLPAAPDEPMGPDEVEDFDAYWSDYGAKPTRVRIMGEVVELPGAVPLRFQTEAARLQNSESLDDIAHLCSILLPGQGDVLDRWIDHGMDVERLGVFLSWAVQRIAGNKITFAQAAEQYAEQVARKNAFQARDQRAAQGNGPVPT